MTSLSLLHPSQLTPDFHAKILLDLQNACQTFNQSFNPKRALQVRDFWFYIEDGQTVVDLFVEPLTNDSAAKPFPAPEEAVSLDECFPFHQFLLEDGVLDVFDDSVGVRVGSLGLEPPLRTVAHFKSAQSHLVTFKTWTKRQGRDRFTGSLDEIKVNDSAPSLVLREGTEVIEVPLSAVKFAQVLLEKPKAAQANAPKKSRRG
jgi:ribosome maturation factor RimP